MNESAPTMEAVLASIKAIVDPGGQRAGDPLQSRQIDVPAVHLPAPSEPLKLPEHTVERRAAITAAAREAGAHNPEAILRFIQPGAMVNAVEAVANLRKSEPVLFKKTVAEMDATEFATAKREVIRAAEKQRGSDDQAALMGRLQRKYATPKDSK